MVTIMSGRAACAALLLCPAACRGHAIVQDSSTTWGLVLPWPHDGFFGLELKALWKAYTGTLFGAGDVFAATDGLLFSVLTY